MMKTVHCHLSRSLCCLWLTLLLLRVVFQPISILSTHSIITCQDMDSRHQGGVSWISFCGNFQTWYVLGCDACFNLLIAFCCTRLWRCWSQSSLTAKCSHAADVTVSSSMQGKGCYKLTMDIRKIKLIKKVLKVHRITVQVNVTCGLKFIKSRKELCHASFSAFSNARVTSLHF